MTPRPQVVTPIRQAEPVVRSATGAPETVTVVRVPVVLVVVGVGPEVGVVSVSVGPVEGPGGGLVVRLARGEGVGRCVDTSVLPLPLAVRRLPLMMGRVRPDGKTRPARGLLTVVRRVGVVPVRLCFRRRPRFRPCPSVPSLLPRRPPWVPAPAPIPEGFWKWSW